MDPLNLLLPDGTPSRVWVCGACNLTAADEDLARKCCTLIPCRYCGEPTESKYRHGFESACHDECERGYRARSNLAHIERAEKLDDWDGPVWDGGSRGDMGNGYFSSLGAYLDHLHDELDPTDWPEWVHACTARHPRADAESVLENVLEDSWEGMDESDLNGVKELVVAIELFNRANESVNVYDVDMRRVVRVPHLTVSAEQPQS